MENYVDFSDFDETYEDSDVRVTTSKNEKEIYNLEYDSETSQFYRTLREKKYNTFTQCFDKDFDADNAFKFYYKWDPYTGERLGLDPYGPLYFHPDDLIHHFDLMKLNTLWNEPVDEIDHGYFSGYYGEALGAGDDITIESRGEYPELYLFRLPVFDCYLPPGHKMSIITMGPKLTTNELAEIDQLASRHYKNNYAKLYGKKRPVLVDMERIYLRAIDKTPTIKNVDPILFKKMSQEKKQKLYNECNMDAVQKLKKM